MAITGATRKMLWGRAHNQCAFPGCIQALTLHIDDDASGDTQLIVIGEEAHIRAQSAGGPRYDPDYPRDKVDSYENLVLMCPTHHTLIDSKNGAGHALKDLLKIKEAHERQQGRRAELEGALGAYLGDRYHVENTVQFQQADLRGPSVDSLFVDVPVGCRRDNSQLAQLLTQIAESAPGDTSDLEATSAFIVTGATQALLHPDWTGNAVLVGGPGQGKSTVLQYICQFHRARRLGETDYSAGQSELLRAASTARFPIRVDLRKYAQWAAIEPSPDSGKKKRSDQKPESEGDWRSLEEYIVLEIRRHIGAHQFKNRDLAVLIATEPVLLALDGLDEVASLTVRARVTEEIARVRARLNADAANLVILVATRPGSSLQPLTGTGAFPVLHLQKLTQGLRLQYLQRWVEVSGLSTESAERLQSTFMDNQHVPHINELASYPMQLAILLHLLHRRQLLPQQRTELYAEYLKTFLDREQTEDKEPLLAEQRRVVESTHAYLGWYLQTKAEQGQSSGSITRADLRQLLRQHLAGQADELTLAEELYSAITTRVLCLVERDDAFEFEVQSLREYFAALYIFENLTPKGVGNSRDDGLNALMERPYWANVCRFYIGMLATGEIRALKDNLHNVDKRVSPHPMVRLMAVLLLNDRVYDGLAGTSIRDVVDVVLDGPGVVFAEDGVFEAAGTPLRLGERAGRSQAVAHLKARLEENESIAVQEAAAKCLARHAIPRDEIATWWWSLYDSTPNWFEVASTLGVLGSLNIEHTAQLHKVLAETNRGTAWNGALLARGGYDGKDEDVLLTLVQDLNDGAAGEIQLSSGRHNLAAIVQSAELASSGAVRRSTLYAGKGGNESLELSQQADVTERILRGATAASIRSFDPSSLEAWQTRLLALAEAWGDGWILRRAVSTIPSDVEISAIATSVRVKSPALAAAATAEAAFRSNRGNEKWWREHLVSLATPRDLMLGTIALIEHAHASVFTPLASTFDALVQKLEPKRFLAVEHALQMDVAARRARPLALQEALRLRQVNLSGRTLWLIHIIGTASTRSRVGPLLEPQLEDVFKAGTTDGREAVAVARTTRKLKLEIFRGARRSLPPGGWADESAIAIMTQTTAAEILTDPVNWPTDLVQMAIDRLTIRQGNRTKPLADVATSNRWFQDPA
jgi:hypothetical protein